MEIVFCANGNRRFSQIAKDAGFLLGAQLPGTVYFSLWFADQNWKNPNRDQYMKALAQHRPYMATVLDYEHPEQRTEILSWAEEAAQFVEIIQIIPKWSGAIAELPHKIGNRPIRLGYSVPTSHGGTSVPLWEFTNWPHGVHLLGGSPHKQMYIANYMPVRSVDGNMAMGLALRWAQFWTNGTARNAANRYWPKLEEMGMRSETDAPYVAFELSCKNIMNAYQEFTGVTA